jgi:hypothetical protein
MESVVIFVCTCAHREAPKNHQVKLGDFLERSGGGGESRSQNHFLTLFVRDDFPTRIRLSRK